MKIEGFFDWTGRICD